MDDESGAAEGSVVNFRGSAAGGSGYFGLAATAEQRLVDFRLRDGRRTSFAYEKLGFLDYDDEDGMITIEFGPFVVTVIGVGLNVIYEGLFEHRIRWLRESFAEDSDDLLEGVRIDSLILTPPAPVTFNLKLDPSLGA